MLLSVEEEAAAAVVFCKPKLMLDAVAVLLLSLFRLENEPTASTISENFVFCCSSVLDVTPALLPELRADCLEFEQHTQVALSDSFLMRHDVHVHFDVPRAISSFSLVSTLDLKHLEHNVFDSSFCVRLVNLPSCQIPPGRILTCMSTWETTCIPIR